MIDATRIAILSAIISMMALVVSATTMYFTWLRRGRLAMTKPTLVFFGFDSVPQQTAKIFLRTLLYSTSVKGKVVESMYAKLLRGDHEQIFSFWGHAETDKIAPGSGLFVAQSGVLANHHFVLSMLQPAYEFVAGEYKVEVFARLAGGSMPIKLVGIAISMSESQAGALRDGAGVLFELEPDKQVYVGHVDNQRPVGLRHMPAPTAPASQDRL